MARAFYAWSREVDDFSRQLVTSDGLYGTRRVQISLKEFHVVWYCRSDVTVAVCVSTSMQTYLCTHIYIGIDRGNPQSTIK